MDLDNGSIERLLREVLNIFKEAMKTGIPGILPVLDPITVGDFNFTVEEKSVQAKPSISNVVVEGLSSFYIPVADVDMENLNASAIITAQDLKCSGQYQLNGTALYVAPLSGHGGFLLEADAVKSTISIQLHMASENKLHIKVDVREISFDASAIKVHFDNLEGGGVVGSLLNEILNLFAMKIFHMVEPMLANSVKTALQQLIDDFLEKIPFPIHEDVLHHLSESHPFRLALHRPYHSPQLVQSSGQEIPLNTLFDKVIANLNRLIAKEGYDPWAVPGQAESHFKRWIFSGGAKFYETKISGISHFVRTSDITSDPSTKTTLTLNFGLPLAATGGGKWKAWFTPVDRYGHAGVTISNLKVRAQLQLRDDGYAEIVKLVLATDPDIDASVSGLGSLDWMCEIFVNTIIAFLNPFLKNLVIPRIKHLLQEELGKFRIPIRS